MQVKCRLRWTAGDEMVLRMTAVTKVMSVTIEVADLEIEFPAWIQVARALCTSTLNTQHTFPIFSMHSTLSAQPVHQSNNATSRPVYQAKNKASNQTYYTQRTQRSQNCILHPISQSCLRFSVCRRTPKEILWRAQTCVRMRRRHVSRVETLLSHR